MENFIKYFRNRNIYTLLKFMKILLSLLTRETKSPYINRYDYPRLSSLCEITVNLSATQS